VGLAGAGIPVQRAGYGAILVLAGALIGRPSSLLNVLCFALCSILLWSPMSLWNIGLQLSFLSVFSLILVLPLLSRFNAWMLSLGSSLAVLLGTFPVILFYFNIFSPVSILANLAAIPLFDGALFTALFALIFNGVPFMGIFFARISSWILGAGLAWVRHLSFLRGGYWFFERPGPWLLMAYYACLGLVLFFHKKTFPGKRWLMTGLMVCWLTVTAIFFIKPDQKRFEAAIFASGRNQVLYARFANGAEWLLNAGRSFPSDQGEWLIVPFLRGRGSRSLEGIAFTDLSRKHTGGMGSVLRDFPARFILYPSGYADTAREIFGHRPRHGSSVRAFQAGNSIHMEMETVRVLACSKKGTALMIETGPWRLLLVSRWDAELFTELLKRWDDANEIHAVFLPALDYGIPPEFRSWFDRVRPILTVSYKPAEDLERFLASRSAPSIDLEHSGALFFRREGLKLTLSSYVKGSMGFYSYH
jgi:competence protein ComEC